MSTMSVLSMRRHDPPLRVPPLAVDGVIAAAVIGWTLVMVRSGFATSRPSTMHLDVMGVVSATVVGLPLLARRRLPFVSFLVSAGASALMAARGYPIGLPLAPAVGLYFVAAGRTEDLPWTRVMTGAAAALLGAYLVGAAATEATFPASQLFHAGLLWSAAWFAGERTRLRREQIEELKREAQRERLLAGAEERARIARDLHDSVGHAINVIGVRAGAARMRHASEPERSLQALEAIEDLARRTVDDIDHFVGALRISALDQDGVDTPLGLASVPSLISQHTSAGLQVGYVVSGTIVPLSPVVDQALYRIIQEALTNASRHGTGSARLSVDFVESAVVLTITNPVRQPEPATFRVGHGLVGMNERARLVGGSLDIAHPPGEYVVRARLPLDSFR